MKVTLFTSNQPRHLSFANLLSKNFSEVFAIVESNTVFPGKINDFYKDTSLMKTYFSKVMNAEKKVFNSTSYLKKNITCLPMKMGDLNMCEFKHLKIALNSDIYIIFGASYIKGWLVEYLINNNAINIHMGLSPYYRGSSCNFWALYDSNPSYVGATMHMLSKGLDSGKILFHSTPEYNNESPYIFTMKAVKKAQDDLVKKIKNNSIFNIKSMKQNKDLEIRYSRYLDFNDEVVQIFIERNIKSTEIKRLLQKSNKPKLYNVDSSNL